MNTKYEIGQRVSFPVQDTHTANIDSIQICKGGKVLYSVGGKMVEESALTAETSAVPAFGWKKFKAGGVAVHCGIRENAKAFMRECKSHGMRWNGGEDLPNDENWTSYGRDTCYDAEGCFLTFCSRSYYVEHGYTIIDFPFLGE